VDRPPRVIDEIAEDDASGDQEGDRRERDEEEHRHEHDLGRHGGARPHLEIKSESQCVGGDQKDDDRD
jgi:hypothetical protein